MNAPCYNCSGRTVACHDNCPRYQTYKNDRGVIQSNRKNSNFLQSYFSDTIHKSEKLRRQHA
jgi:hypothetical protein